jgi:hypothetical protein
MTVREMMGTCKHVSQRIWIGDRIGGKNRRNDRHIVRDSVSMLLTKNTKHWRRLMPSFLACLRITTSLQLRDCIVTVHSMLCMVKSVYVPVVGVLGNGQ